MKTKNKWHERLHTYIHVHNVLNAQLPQNLDLPCSATETYGQITHDENKNLSQFKDSLNMNMLRIETRIL